MENAGLALSEKAVRCEWLRKCEEEGLMASPGVSATRAEAESVVVVFWKRQCACGIRGRGWSRVDLPQLQHKARRVAFLGRHMYYMSYPANRGGCSISTSIAEI